MVLFLVNILIFDKKNTKNSFRTIYPERATYNLSMSIINKKLSKKV